MQVRLRSFVRRQGRLRYYQRVALETLWSKYTIAFDHQSIDFFNVFGRHAPCVVEIGFGMGHALVDMAKKHPENNYLGIEVHRPGIGALLASLEIENIENVRVICGDAVQIFETIPDNSLSGILLFFPDPWPKTRHHKRRLLQLPFVELIQQKLRAHAALHIATDWEDYAVHCMNVMSAATGFENQAGANHFLPRPVERPITKYERRAQRLGHAVWDLVFVKQKRSASRKNLDATQPTFCKPIASPEKPCACLAGSVISKQDDK